MVVAASVVSFVEPYTDTMRGDGAPRWVVQDALPHKDMDSSHWGDPVYMLHPRNTGAPPSIKFGAGGAEIVDGAVMLLQKAVAGALADSGLNLEYI